ncbi:hypothetical protein UA08_06414 [Talaromyces atroroseus]|uniref:Uncharacterized protein n=1 Tax=Talaromyces atroroseus TaxID=1441469 RepID=A0A225ARF6_TALAT|nr:hypothetical protein UA08_06414 [Talaromyces atroroseus]OKL58169.1 hypothetical protein UA08_06414 [Talaromyces atroroseus]
MAPLCLELLALCTLTAARDDARGIILVPNKKSEYLKGLFCEETCSKADSKVGKALLKAIGDADTVVSEMKVERTTSRNLRDNWKPPPKDSKLVFGWQSKVKKSRKDVQKLDAKNKTLTSGSKNPRLPGANLQAAASAGSKTASQMAVEAASFKTQMNNIKSDLDSLKDDKVTLEAVKVCLRNCLTLLVELKDCILQLRLFFTQLSVQIKTLVKGNVIPFKGTVEDAISSPNALIDRVILQQYTVAIWAGFDQFTEVAEFYKSVHDPYIVNGLALVNRMTLQNNVTAGYKEIEQYAQTSQAAVKGLINKETKKFKSRLQKTYGESMELESTALSPTKDEEDALFSAVKNVQGVVEEQLNAKAGPIHYLTQPREQRDAQADKLSRALDSETLQQQTHALKQEESFVQDEDE